ncbi:response regulator [Cellulophaga sp. Z1A5H]|uniref:response regulator n=1 Tax=Cellulophaga sp. Z1A5H TaxID=2687291 RepID=UPI0013FDF0ED|nr:response regulator [Cellulophaga sp. Z1A5H]
MTDSKLNLWLIDDDEDDRAFFIEGLESLNVNFELEEFINGKEAVSFFEENVSVIPDMIFLDLNMPIMNGIECLDYIRTHERLKNVIIAMYSTSSSGQDIQCCYEKGANLYIIKPNRFQDLKNCMKKILSMNWPDFLCNFKKEDFILKA